MTSGLLLLTVALAGSPQAAPAASDPTVASTRGAFDLVKNYVLKTADQLPEELYAFKPTPEVRSAGEILGHIADANFMICGAASGEKGSMSNIEKTKKTKAELKEALAASFTFCDKAYDGMTEAKANETVKFFLPGTHTRLGVLVFNTAHDFEHYGNLVTYMRLKGLVPPSSARGM
jgi:uncharacterized damage-inducible protein DinB